MPTVIPAHISHLDSLARYENQQRQAVRP